MNESFEGRWLLLIHQIPPKPAYFRVKIWRRLQRLGAVAIKNSVYVLPKNEQTQEDFQWVLREVTQGGGDATVCDARFVEGLSDEEVEALFEAARAADYKHVAEEARRLAETLPSKGGVDERVRGQFEVEIARLKRRLTEVAAIDFFGAPGREQAEALVLRMEARIRGTQSGKQLSSRGTSDPAKLKGKTWVTRKGIHVDRMASAWFIRRFIDADAQLKFVPAKGYKPLSNEIRFDMFDAEFTHEGDRCTLEVLIERLGFDDAAVSHIAEIVHDIDLKESKFEREETVGIERLIAGIAMAHKDDDTRLERGYAVFDDLYEYFRRKSSRGDR
jgi:hypothetical protein